MKTIKRAMLLWIVAGSLVGLASCSFSVGSGGEEPTQGPDVAATRAALEATRAALEATQAALLANPTETPAEPTVEAAALSPSDTPAPEAEPFYTEEFSSAPDTWSYLLLSGDEADLDIYTQSDGLVFDITGENVWPYYTYDSYTYTDVRVDARATNLGTNTNNISLICRYTDFGWYEFNVFSSGLYTIYRYESNTNNFHELYSGGVQNLKTGKATNDFAIICEGDRLTLGVNGVEIRTVEDSAYTDGLVGVAVASAGDGVVPSVVLASCR